MFQLLELFIEEYFDQNPISQLGIIVTKNKRAEKVTELGGGWTTGATLNCHNKQLNTFYNLHAYLSATFCLLKTLKAPEADLVT